MRTLMAKTPDAPWVTLVSQAHPAFYPEDEFEAELRAMRATGLGAEEVADDEDVEEEAGQVVAGEKGGEKGGEKVTGKGKEGVAGEVGKAVGGREAGTGSAAAKSREEGSSGPTRVEERGSAGKRKREVAERPSKKVATKAAVKTARPTEGSSKKAARPTASESKTAGPSARDKGKQRARSPSAVEVDSEDEDAVKEPPRKKSRPTPVPRQEKSGPVSSRVEVVLPPRRSSSGRVLASSARARASGGPQPALESGSSDEGDGAYEPSVASEAEVVVVGEDAVEGPDKQGDSEVDPKTERERKQAWYQHAPPGATCYGAFDKKEDMVRREPFSLLSAMLTDLASVPSVGTCRWRRGVCTRVLTGVVAACRSVKSATPLARYRPTTPSSRSRRPSSRLGVTTGSSWRTIWSGEGSRPRTLLVKGA